MFSDFFSGIKSYGRAFQIIGKLNLWGFTLIPMLITFVLMGIIGFSAYGLADNLGNWLISWWRWEWGSTFITGVGSWLGGILIFILGVLSLKYIVLIVVAPFMSILSEKIEAKVTGYKSNATFSLNKAIKDMLRGLRLALRNISRELFFTLILILVGFIPLVGVVSSILIFLVQSYYAGFGNTDYTLERHYTFRESIEYARKNMGLMIGNGVVFMLLLMTGIGFLFAPTLSTVAATLETLDRLDTVDYK